MAPASRLMRVLLTCGLIAGPFYLVVGLIQALTRPGFDLLHDDLSLLANGELGWIQITNLLLTGALVGAFALGLRRGLPPGPGRRWGPILLGIYGLGLIGAGTFTADPAFGFPPGHRRMPTPSAGMACCTSSRPGSASWR